jgi:hypothetical protein
MEREPGENRGRSTKKKLLLNLGVLAAGGTIAYASLSYYESVNSALAQEINDGYKKCDDLATSYLKQPHTPPVEEPTQTLTYVVEHCKSTVLEVVSAEHESELILANVSLLTGLTSAALTLAKGVEVLHDASRPLRQRLRRQRREDNDRENFRY